MAINQQLLKKIQTKLRIGRTRVYVLIQDIALTYHVSNHVASLKLAADHGIAYSRYANADDRAELRATSGGHAPAPLPAAVAQPLRPPSSTKAPSRPKATRDNSIFVVHGRNLRLRDDMYALLRSLGLTPIEWAKAIDDAKGANPNIGQVVDNALKKAQGILVLLSPDEDAKLKKKFSSPKDVRSRLTVLEGQPRPNVIFEAGIALGLHPDKTLLVQIGDIREISDIAGKHMLHFDGSHTSRNELIRRLKKLRFTIDTVNDSWITVGKFER
jgi:predicted nucleotide-binding protein